MRSNSNWIPFTRQGQGVCHKENLHLEGLCPEPGRGRGPMSLRDPERALALSSADRPAWDKLITWWVMEEVAVRGNVKSLQLSTTEKAALRTHIVHVLSTPHLEPSFKSGTIIPYSSCFHPHCIDREIEAYPQSTRVWILMVPVLCVCLLLIAGCFMPLCMGFPGAYETQGLSPFYVFMGGPLCWDLEFQVSHS